MTKRGLSRRPRTVALLAAPALFALVAAPAAAQAKKPRRVAFEGAVASRFEGSLVSTVLADLNGDRFLDLAGIRTGPLQRVEVFFGRDGEPFPDVPERATPIRFPAAIVVPGDYTGDGLVDLAIVGQDFYSREVDLLVGTGDGGFVPGGVTSASFRPAAASSDLDGDGRNELILAYWRGIEPRLSVLGVGSEGATLALREVTGITFDWRLGLDGVAIGDFDGDGLKDVVVSGIGGGHYPSPPMVAVFIGDGALGFSQPVRSISTAGSGIPPGAVAVADFDGDGCDDVVTSFNDRDAFLFRCTPGSVDFWGQLSTTDRITGLGAGDLDGDGIPELLMCSESRVDLRRGLGGFAFGSPRAFPGTASTVMLLDIDQDGFRDLAAISATAFTAHFGDGRSVRSGFSVAGSSLPSGRAAVETADVDLDGRTDCVVATLSGVGVAYGDGAGGAREARLVRRTPTSTSYGADVASGLFNADTFPDFVVVSGTQFRTSPLPARIFLSDETGALRSIGNLDLGPGVLPVSAADLDGDGALDLVYGGTSGEVKWLVGRGDGSFDSPRSFAVGLHDVVVSPADWNADGLCDVLAVAAGRPNTFDLANLEVWIGSAGGTFARGPSFGALVAGAREIRTGDFDGDGQLDAAVAHARLGLGVTIVHGPDLARAARLITGSNVDRLASADMNGDGAPEVLAVEEGGSLTVLGWGGPGGFDVLGAHATLPPSSGSLRAADFDEDGFADLVTPMTSGGVALLLNRTAILAAMSGGVGASAVSAPERVLRVNGLSGAGADRTVFARAGEEGRLSLGAALAGPRADARYGLWFWDDAAPRPTAVRSGSAVLGTAANPTPFRPGATPQPRFAIRGRGVGNVFVAGSVIERPGPESAPFRITLRPRVTARPKPILVQGVLEDLSSPTGVSVTNAVRIEYR